MTPGTRIFLNVIATYGRTVYATFLGIFTSRWILMSIGEVDYGLLGVVGGLIGFITFFNAFLSNSIGRFYAVSIGEAEAALDKSVAMENCRGWFSIAVAIHTIIPLVLIAFGYPIGEWAVRNFLTIPPERIEACVWIWRFSCFSCFVGMVNVPFQSMYVAKQYIAELTIYSFASTTVNACFLYYMVTHPCDWLVKYALWSMCVSVIPQIIIISRACFVFPECRFRMAACHDVRRFGKLFSFAGWQVLNSIGLLASGQGLSIVTNKYFGPSANAAMALGGTVRAHSNALSGALVGAFMPAITAAYGSGDYARMRVYAFRACKFGLLLALIFVLPLSVELPAVMKLWLKNPPCQVDVICFALLISLVVDKCTCGLNAVIMAYGKIAMYQFVSGISIFLLFPLSWVLADSGFDFSTIGVAIVVAGIVYSGCRLWFAKKIANMSIRRWVRDVVPMSILCVIIGGVGVSAKRFFAEGFVRIACTSVLIDVVFLCCVWLWLLSDEERSVLNGIVRKCLRKG